LNYKVNIAITLKTISECGEMSFVEDSPCVEDTCIFDPYDDSAHDSVP